MTELDSGYIAWMAGTDAYNGATARPTEKAFTPNEPRDGEGRWTKGGAPAHGTTVDKGPGSGRGSRPSQYDFVQAPSGGNAWWHIDDATAQAAGLEKGGEIRVQYGFQHPTEEKKGFGLVHLDFRHKKDYKAAGFTDAREFLAHVLRDGSEVWSHTEHGEKLLIIGRGTKAGLASVQLRRERGGFFTVVTAFPFLPPTQPGHIPANAKTRLKSWQAPGGSLNPHHPTRVTGCLTDSTSSQTTGPWEQSSIEAGTADESLGHRRPTRKSFFMDHP